jgi:glycosyltransferase involved in cell wall biosynthesis
MDQAKEKTISVIVPVYNMEKYLVQCLDSIVGQSYRHLEILLIDDGSTDRSPEICDRYAAEDERIKVIHRKNGGLSAARNTGLDAAAGEYVGFVDSDDWLDGDMYEFLLGDLLSAGADIAVCGYYITTDDSEEPNDKSGSYRVLGQAEALELLLQDGILQNFYWCKLYKRALFDSIRMPEGKTFEDAFTQHLLFEKVQKVVLHNVPKYHYRYRSDSVCGRIKSFMNEDYHASFYERVRYYSGRGELRFYRQAAVTYLNHLYWSYRFHMNLNDQPLCAEHREKYAAFCREIREGRFPRLRGRFLYDLAFSGYTDGSAILWIYDRYQSIKKTMKKMGR